LLTWLPAPTLAACGCAVLGMIWITHSAIRRTANQLAEK
jgi:hypothetical protein